MILDIKTKTKKDVKQKIHEFFATNSTLNGACRSIIYVTFGFFWQLLAKKNVITYYCLYQSSLNYY